jgi:hypothetical protein
MKIKNISSNHTSVLFLRTFISKVATFKGPILWKISEIKIQLLNVSSDSMMFPPISWKLANLFYLSKLKYLQAPQIHMGNTHHITRLFLSLQSKSSTFYIKISLHDRPNPSLPPIPHTDLKDKTGTNLVPRSILNGITGKVYPKVSRLSW